MFLYILILIFYVYSIYVYIGLDGLHTREIVTSTGESVDFVAIVLAKRAQFQWETTNSGELAAFIEYAQAFPTGFLALVDTYVCVLLYP